jgi:hypothetical protein
MVRIALIAGLLALTSHAHADTWSHTAEQQRSRSTSIKVTEPEGYRITVNGRTDTIPALFDVADADAYVELEVEAPSGATWHRKIEVKAYRQTAVRIRHTASVKAAPEKERTPRAAAFIGVAANTTHLCGKRDRSDIRVQFVLANERVKTVDLAVRSRADVELPAGQYRIRRFHRGRQGWDLAGTQALEVTKDGWIYNWGCEARR